MPASSGAVVRLDPDRSLKGLDGVEADVGEDDAIGGGRIDFPIVPV